MKNNLLASALHYAGFGWRVLPVRQNSKIPAIKSWSVEASNNHETVTKMFSNHIGNIGVACDSGSGIIVIDIDMPDGPETLETLQAELGPLPQTLSQRTGNNGMHLIYQYPEGYNIRGSIGVSGNGLGKNIDVRGEGSQIVVAPSFNEDNNPYIWINDIPIAELPPKWIERMVCKTSQASPIIQVTNLATPDINFSDTNSRHPYVEVAIQNELTKMREAQEGERNNTLFKAACSIGGWLPDNHLAYDEAHALLFQAAEANGYVQDDGIDAAKNTIASGLNAGMATPRQIPFIPPGFSIVTEGQHPGLYYTEKGKDDEPKKIWLGPPIHILGLVRDNVSESWGLFLKWNNPDNRTHKWVLPYELLAGYDSSVWRSRLASGGWSGTTSKQAKEFLARYLNESKPTRHILSVSQTGWHQGAFVFPDEAIYPSNMPEDSIVLQEASKQNPYYQGGCLES